MVLKPLLNRAETRGVAHLVLRHCRGPAVNSEELGLNPQIQNFGEFLPSQAEDLIVAEMEDTGVARPTEETTEQGASWGNTMVELFMDKGTGQQPALFPVRHQKSESCGKLLAHAGAVSQCDRHS